MHQNLTHDIERYILELLEEEQDNFISLRRKELAEMFECVPSQINYVLRSRFSPEQGYLIESRRGEHGYIKIFKITCDSPDDKVIHIKELIGNEISVNEAHKLLKALQEREFITARERLLIEISLRHAEYTGMEKLGLSHRSIDTLNADLLKKMLGGLMLS